MAPGPSRGRGPTLRAQRLRYAWLLAFPYIFLAKPTATTILVGAFISLCGLLVRAVAAGSIHKDRALAVDGIYGRLRHPLYLGSFLVGLGLALSGGRWWFAPLFLGVFSWLYRRTIRAEEEGLHHRFGKEYAEYRERVPAFVPRLESGRSEGLSLGFHPWLYRRNKEWQAALGVVAGYALLFLRRSLGG